MASRYSQVWTETTPVPSDILGYVYQHMQNLRRDFRERMNCPEWSIYYRLKDLGTVAAGTVNLDLSQGDCFLCTLPNSGTVTFSVINAPSNSYDEKVMVMFTLVVKNPSSGTPTVAWSSQFKKYSTDIDTTANKHTVFQYISWDCTNFYGGILFTGV